MISKESDGNRGGLVRTVSLDRFANEDQQTNILMPQFIGQNSTQDLHKKVYMIFPLAYFPIFMHLNTLL